MRTLITAVTMLTSLSAQGAHTAYPVPKGASEIGHVILQPGVAEQDHFFFAEKYPGSSAMDHYHRVFAKWRPCYWNEREWSSFSDLSGPKPQLIHRFVRHWASPANDIAVTVAIQYTSPGIAHQAVPANERQFVVVAIRRSTNAERDLAQIDAKCEKAT